MSLLSSFRHGGNMDLPTEYMLLDGYSLSTDDLLQLGKNRYKIKVMEIYSILSNQIDLECLFLTEISLFGLSLQFCS